MENETGKKAEFGDDYFYITKIISLLAGRNKNDLRKRYISYFLITLTLLISIPYLIQDIHGFYLYKDKSVILIALWILIAPILVDYFEFLIDEFKIKFGNQIIGKTRSKDNLNKNDDLKKEGKKEFKKVFNKIFSDKLKERKLMNVTIVIISIPIYIGAAFVIPNALPGIIYWSSLHWILIFFTYPFILTGTIILYLAAKNIYFMRDICSEEKFTIEVDPYKGDRFGGLSTIGNYSILITILVSTFSFGIPHAYIRMQHLTGWERMVPMVLTGFILLGVLITFLVPLYHVNRLARDKKDELLKVESINLKTLLKEIDETGKNTTEIKNKYDVHMQYYKHIMEMKEWPFDTKTFFALIASILLPIILTAIPYLIGAPT